MTLKDRLIDSLSGSTTTGYGNFGSDDGVTVPHKDEFGKAFGKDGRISVGKPTVTWSTDSNTDNSTEIEQRGDTLDGATEVVKAGQKTDTGSAIIC